MSGIYCCPHCLKSTGTPELLDELPSEELCECFPLHGQWMSVTVQGECVGSVLLDSDLIRQMREQNGQCMNKSVHD